MVRKGSRVQVPQRALTHALASAGAFVVQRVFDCPGTLDRASSGCAGFLGDPPPEWEDARAVNDLLPLLAFPLACGWYFTSRRHERELHATLRSATADHAPRPLLDAGPVPVLRVAASLALPGAQTAALSNPALWWGGRRARMTAFSAFIAPLGLRLDDAGARRLRREPHPNETMRLVGERHGRRVEVLLAPDRQEVRLGLQGAVDYRVQGADGRLEASPESDGAIRTGLQGLHPHRRWNDLAVTGGPAWVRVERRGSGTDSWVHDLWLAEFIGDLALLAAPESSAVRSRGHAAPPLRVG